MPLRLFPVFLIVIVLSGCSWTTRDWIKAGVEVGVGVTTYSLLGTDFESDSIAKSVADFFVADMAMDVAGEAFDSVVDPTIYSLQNTQTQSILPIIDEPESTEIDGWVIGGIAKLRYEVALLEKPTFNSNVIEYLVAESEVLILEEEGFWLKVRHITNNGFISKKWVSKHID